MDEFKFLNIADDGGRLSHSSGSSSCEELVSIIDMGSPTNKAEGKKRKKGRGEKAKKSKGKERASRHHDDSSASEDVEEHPSAEEHPIVSLVCVSTSLRQLSCR